MRSTSTYLLSLTACLLTTGVTLLSAADPAQEIKGYSMFESIDIPALVKGEILAERGEAMEFERGLTVQTCYVVKRDVATTTALLERWDPVKHKEMDVYISHCFVEGEDPRFAELLKFDPTIRPVRRFFEEMLKAVEGESHMQMTADDLARLKSRFKKDENVESKEFVAKAEKFWAEMFATKFDQFAQKGMKGLPVYRIGGEDLSVATDIQTLLKEDQAISQRFHLLLKDSLLSTTPEEKTRKPDSYYWQIFKADKESTCLLGASYIKDINDKKQMIDFQFYVSNAYFASATLYELHPIKVDGKEYTLVWRADFVSAPLFAWLKGVQQMAAGSLMIQSIKESVRFFQEDAINYAAPKQ